MRPSDHDWKGTPPKQERREGDEDRCCACGLGRVWSTSADRWIYLAGHPKSGKPCDPYPRDAKGGG